jgi:uncharacterized protein (TIGR03032 family)
LALNNSPPFRYVHSDSFADILHQLKISLFLSTYQAGKLMIVRAIQGKLTTLLRNFDRVMGLALNNKSLAIGTRRQIWFLDNIPRVADQIDPPNSYDACFLPRSSHVTGDIRIHEMAWIDGELWFVNTQFSCLCTLHQNYNFVPRWQPPFITKLKAEDRCHLNGLALSEGQLKYVTLLAESDRPQGWRDRKVTGGCILDLESGEVIARGLCMPHSPRVYDNRLWVLDSGWGRLLVIDPKTGDRETTIELPGFARGLAFCDRYAFIGLSQIRDKETFGGLPLEQSRDNLQCAIWIVDIDTGKPVGFLKFESGCTELFDVQILANCRYPTAIGFQRSTIDRVFVF